MEEGVFGGFGGEEEGVRRRGAGYGGEGGVILKDCDGVGGEGEGSGDVSGSWSGRWDGLTTSPGHWPLQSGRLSVAMAVRGLFCCCRRAESLVILYLDVCRSYLNVCVGHRCHLAGLIYGFRSFGDI